ncbi:MAG: hypothetical protein ACFE96_08515 [Candidatus Hermodarchaeota archaeon]
MYLTQKITRLKRISIIPFLFASIPFAFILLFLRDIPFISSLFIEYVDSGNSIFFPFLSSPIIVFQFTTGHLIDLIIIGNIIAFLERGGYYYVNVCLKRNYLIMYSETSILDINRPKQDSVLEAELPLCLKKDLNPIDNDESFDSLYKANNICSNFSSSKGNLTEKYCSLHHLRNKLPFINYYTSFKYRLTNKGIFYDLPPEYNRILSHSCTKNIMVEGRH